MCSWKDMIVILFVFGSQVALAQDNKATPKRTSGADFERMIVGKWVQTDALNNGYISPAAMQVFPNFMEEYRANGDYYEWPPLKDYTPNMKFPGKNELHKFRWKFYPDTQVLYTYHGDQRRFEKYDLISLTDSTFVMNTINDSGLTTLYFSKYLEAESERNGKD